MVYQTMPVLVALTSGCTYIPFSVAAEWIKATVEFSMHYVRLSDKLRDFPS